MSDIQKTVVELLAELEFLRTRDEEELRHREERLHDILEATADGIVAVDAEGKVIQSNKRFAELWGIPDAIMETGDDDAMLSFVLDQLADPDAFIKKVKLLYSTAEHETDLLQFKDGRVFERYSAPLFTDCSVVGRVWSFRDVTENKRAEEALKKSEEKYRLLMEISPNAISVTDPTGCIRMVNRQALDLYGYEDGSDVLGRSIFEWVAPESQQRAAEAFDEFLVNGVTRNLELLLYRKDGSSFWALANFSLIKSSQGEPQLAIIVTTDITQQKQLEEERLKLQKLESLGLLAGGIAHDFNNLLQGVFGYISMAKRSLGSEEYTTGLLEQAEHALTMSINLTTQLLTFAKGGKPIKKQFVLAPVIEDAAKFALSGSRSSCHFVPCNTDWQVIADEGQFRQVIQNIILNASEAMPDGGTVEISFANTVISPGDHTLLPFGGRFVRIDIRDSGIGIPPEYISRIFDPYFTTKQKGGGLGLATAFSIMRNHGGALEVASEPNMGSTFSLYLPACEGAEEEETPQPVAISGRKARMSYGSS